MAGEVFECEIQARLRDVNLGGHVDNVEAMRIIDEARVLFLRFAELGALDGVQGAGIEGAGIEGAGLLEPVPAGVVELMGSQRVDQGLSRAPMAASAPPTRRAGGVATA